MAEAVFNGDDRRRIPRIQLTGAALVTSSRDARRAFTAVLDNVNRLGAGFHAREALEVREPVIVTLVFLNLAGQEEKERIPGEVAWVKTYERGVLLGVMWRQDVTAERNPHLAAYLQEMQAA